MSIGPFSVFKPTLPSSFWCTWSSINIVEAHMAAVVCVIVSRAIIMIKLISPILFSQLWPFRQFLLQLRELKRGNFLIIFNCANLFLSFFSSLTAIYTSWHTVRGYCIGGGQTSQGFSNDIYQGLYFQGSPGKEPLADGPVPLPA